MDKDVMLKKQMLSLEDRKIFTMTGVIKVESSNESLVMLKTNLGDMTVRGKGFAIGMLNVETGQFSMTGEVSRIEFKGNSGSNKPFLLR